MTLFIYDFISINNILRWDIYAAIILSNFKAKVKEISLPRVP